MRARKSIERSILPLVPLLGLLGGTAWSIPVYDIYDTHITSIQDGIQVNGTGYAALNGLYVGLNGTFVFSHDPDRLAEQNLSTGGTLYRADSSWTTYKPNGSIRGTESRLWDYGELVYASDYMAAMGGYGVDPVYTTYNEYDKYNSVIYGSRAITETKYFTGTDLHSIVSDYKVYSPYTGLPTTTFTLTETLYSPTGQVSIVTWGGTLRSSGSALPPYPIGGPSPFDEPPVSTAPVPEPSTLALMGLGMGLLAALRGRRKA